MRILITWCVVLLATATAGCNKAPKPVKPVQELVVELGAGVKMEMVLVPAGEFTMGDSKSESGWEEPAHKVTITKPFYLGKYEITQEQWEAVMGNNPSHFRGAQNPVEQVAWFECQVFLDKLNAKAGRQGGKFVLPTEAQWEYACRAGSTGKFCFGDDENQLGEYAWYWNAPFYEKTHAVGKKRPNAFGLYDMHGNVHEWCTDWLGEDYYATSPTNDPTGPTTGSSGRRSSRVTRGGSWRDDAWQCRAACRSGGSVDCRINSTGFRVAQVPADK